MDKEREITEMALLIVNDILLGHTAEETAKHLVNEGYGDTKQAVREFAERLKFVFYCDDLLCDIERIRTIIDELLAEVIGK